jgi:hypothetical protein
VPPDHRANPALPRRGRLRQHRNLFGAAPELHSHQKVVCRGETRPWKRGAYPIERPGHDVAFVVAEHALETADTDARIAAGVSRQSTPASRMFARTRCHRRSRSAIENPAGSP